MIDDCFLGIDNVVGICPFCGDPVLESEAYEESDDGGGVMHKECARDEEESA